MSCNLILPPPKGYCQVSHLWGNFLILFQFRKAVDVYKKPTGKCFFHGDHGYDNKINSMQVWAMCGRVVEGRRYWRSLKCKYLVKTLHILMFFFHILLSFFKTVFIGYGPTFKYKTKVPPFENIELYNVMCGKLSAWEIAKAATYFNRASFRFPWAHALTSSQCFFPSPPFPSTCQEGWRHISGVSVCSGAGR